MRTANPVFTSSTFQQPEGWTPATILGGGEVAPREDVMTVRGTALKTLYLVALTIVAAVASWSYYVAHPGAIIVAFVLSIVGSAVFWLVVIKSPKTAPITVPIFALFEGSFAAAMSVLVVQYSRLSEFATTDTVFQAVGLTMAIALGMLLSFAIGFRIRGVAAKVLITMIVGVSLYYVGAFLINMLTMLVFHETFIPRLGWDAGPIGIGFSAVVVVLASLSLVLDFQFVEDGARAGMPKHQEWIGAFGILTSLVWLYIEVLRLLAKIRR